MNEPKPSFIGVYITCSNKDEAKWIAQVLLEKRLIVCANITGGVTSMYWWQGEIQNDSETLLIAKASAECFDQIVTCVKENHSYDVPCILSYAIDNGNPEYLKWLKDETEGD